MLSCLGFGTSQLAAQDAGARTPISSPPHAAATNNLARRLFTINDEISLPPEAAPSNARIVSPKHDETSRLPVTRRGMAIEPMAQPARSETRTNEFGTEEIGTAKRIETGRYVVSFATPLAGKAPQDDATTANDLSGLEMDQSVSEAIDDEPSTRPTLELDDLETDMDDETADAERDPELSDPELSDPELSDPDLDDDMEGLGDDLDDDALEQRQLGVWPKKSIQETRVDAGEYGDKTPEDRSSDLFANSRRQNFEIAATNKAFAWAAPNIRYQPLYFEDVALERYGQTTGLVKQPFRSAVKFFADGALLPARMYRDSPTSCDSPLGFCRPGSQRSVACDCDSGGCETCGYQRGR